jgi:hypothetical protein
MCELTKAAERGRHETSRPGFTQRFRKFGSWERFGGLKVVVCRGDAVGKVEEKCYEEDSPCGFRAFGMDWARFVGGFSGLWQQPR